MTLQIGEELYIVGSTAQFGEWKLSRAIKLSWSQGHVWKCQILVNHQLLESKVEFKFVIVLNGDLQKVQWEGGKQNHELNLNEYVKQFSQPSTMERLNDSKSGGIANLTFPNNMDMVSYDLTKKLIVMRAPWRT